MRKLLQKKILIPLIVAVIVAICVVTTVCVFAEKEAKTMNTSPETGEPTTEPVTEPDSEAPTEPPTEAPTEPPTEAPTEPEPPKLAINYDLLDDIGLSCTELEKKHGEITLFGKPHGGIGYEYENGYGRYCFYEEPFTKRYYDDPDTCPKIYNNLCYDENGYYVLITDEENKCSGIDCIKASDFFLNEGDIVTIDDIRGLDGVEIESEAKDGLPGDPYLLCSALRVEGYENIIIILYHDDPGFIEMDMRVDVR